MFNCQSFEGRRLLAEVDALSQVILRPDDEQFFTMRAGQASERELAGRKFRCEDRERMGGTDLGVMRSRLVHEVLTSWLCWTLGCGGSWYPQTWIEDLSRWSPNMKPGSGSPAVHQDYEPARGMGQNRGDKGLISSRRW